jgi:hypothetical protein
MELIIVHQQLNDYLKHILVNTLGLSGVIPNAWIDAHYK